MSRFEGKAIQSAKNAGKVELVTNPSPTLFAGKHRFLFQFAGERSGILQKFFAVDQFAVFVYDVEFAT